MADKRSNTARNISQICAELDLEVATVTPEAVRLARQPRAGLPDDLRKIDSLRARGVAGAQVQRIGGGGAGKNYLPLHQHAL